MDTAAIRPVTRAARRTLVSCLLIAASATHATAQSFYSDSHVPQLQLTFFEDDWHQQLVDNYNNDNGEWVRADLLLSGVVYPDVGVAHKGDVSYTGGLRESMKIKLDAFDPDQELGEGFDMITLDAARQTNVFSEVAALWILSDFVEAPQVNLAHLVAGTSSLSYDLGVFTNTERVDSSFFRHRFDEKGHRYSPTFDCWPLEYRGTDAGDYQTCYDYQGGDDTTAFQDVADASIALENAGVDTLRTEVAPYLDLDTAMRTVIGDRMLGNFDGLEAGNNYYLGEVVRHGSRITPICWDMDYSFTTSDPVPVPDLYDSFFPLRKIFESATEVERAHTYVRQFMSHGFAYKVISKRLKKLMELALPDMIGSPYDPINSYDDALKAVRRCTIWINRYRDQLDNDPLYQRSLPTFLDVHHDPSSPVEGETVWVNAHLDVAAMAFHEVLLWSRVFGAFEPLVMRDDGQHHDGGVGDGVYGAAMPAARAGQDVQYYVEARPQDLSQHGYGFAPEETEFRPFKVHIGLGQPGDVRLNELLADNENGDVDEAGEADDWLEILNTLDVPADIGGHFLSDDSADPTKWRIPDGTSVPAGGLLRVWCDDDEDDGPLHANFKLSASGEMVLFTAPDGTPLDERKFGKQIEDRSTGRVLDGGSEWFFLWQPTGAAPLVQPGNSARYDNRRNGPSTGFGLSVSGTPRVGQQMTLELRGGGPGNYVFLIAGVEAARFDLKNLGMLIVNPVTALAVRLRLDANGELDVPLIVPPELGDTQLLLQVIDADLSNGLVVAIEK